MKMTIPDINPGDTVHVLTNHQHEAVHTIDNVQLVKRNDDYFVVTGLEDGVDVQVAFPWDNIMSITVEHA